MSYIIVVAFEQPETAQQVASEFKTLERNGALRLSDARVVVKDGDGKIHIQDTAGHPVAWGALIGGALGGILFIMMPFLGIFAGAAVGGAIAKSLNLDVVDKKFISDVSDALKPNTSAVFLQVDDANKAAVIQALGSFKGTLIQTSLSPEIEEKLKKGLEE
ncbi:MAG: DUF1269 domain-containing protein [Anaerolineae bacterium]|nr:DUF1269 domain-containing protein [Anaerolineae bacterium]